MLLRVITNCDGKQCGLGVRVGGGCYICPHYNLKTIYPSIAVEWDYVRNGGKSPHEFAPKSSTKVWWICPKNHCGCHIYESRISNRTVNGRGCPFCVNQKLCAHNNLAAIHPDILLEWDYTRNGNKPETFSSGSDKKVWWKCLKSSCNCHVYEASIHHRVHNGSGCPYCVNHKSCPHNNLATIYPEIAAEWDHSRNNNHPDCFAPASKVKVWWICPKIYADVMFINVL